MPLLERCGCLFSNGERYGEECSFHKAQTAKLNVANSLLLETVEDLDPNADYFEPRCRAVRIFEHLGLRKPPPRQSEREP